MTSSLQASTQTAGNCLQMIAMAGTIQFKKLLNATNSKMTGNNAGSRDSKLRPSFYTPYHLQYLRKRLPDGDWITEPFQLNTFSTINVIP